MKEEFTKKLNSKQRHILVEKGTELPFTGKLLHNKEKGTYCCAGCGQELFSSEDKFDSGSGWPSFYEANKDRVKLQKDNSHGMQRIEVVCSKCNGHLGHFFEDGPKNSRYCINSAALEFKKK